MTFQSMFQTMGSVKLPAFEGIRVMMMPFKCQDPYETLPDYLDYWKVVVHYMSQGIKGTGYLTIDEAEVKKSETHRRPGLHVDGVGPNGEFGGWGGGGGYGHNGMTMVSSIEGCVGYKQEFKGQPGPNGDCEHLRSQLDKSTTLKANHVYWCSPLMVHESIPAPETYKRQFCRVSYPSQCPWYEGYTENPLGIKPTGPIHPARTEFMAYRHS